METEKLVEKLLNEGLELLSSEKKQKQKKGFGTLRAAFGLGSMAAAIMKEYAIKTELGHTKAMNKLLSVSKWLQMLCRKQCLNLAYATFMELAQNRI